MPYFSVLGILKYDSLVGQLTREESHLTSMINDLHDDDNSRDGDDSGHLMILCSE